MSNFLGALGRHSCRMAMQDEMVIRPGTYWVCPTCRQRWEAYAFFGAYDDLRWRRSR